MKTLHRITATEYNSFVFQFSEAIGSSEKPQPNQEITNLKNEIEKFLSVVDLMDKLGIPSSYAEREALVINLFDNGIDIFKDIYEPITDPYQDRDWSDPDGRYSGSVAENGILARNIAKNKHLFKDGVLMAGQLNSWEIVK